jgi:hypothetical protein
MESAHPAMPTRGDAVRQNSRQCLHQQVAGGYVNQRDRFHTHNDSHHFFSSFRGDEISENCRFFYAGPLGAER